jgi:acyl-coenzyme A thioesterase PaaI-like protein
MESNRTMCTKHIEKIGNCQGRLPNCSRARRERRRATRRGGRAWHSLRAMSDDPRAAGDGPEPEDAVLLAADTAAAPPAQTPPIREGGPRSMDGITGFIGMRWDDPQTVRLQIRPELINRGGLLSGVVTYALVDYCMGSTLWAQTTKEERIATISISINYIQTATEGEIVCRSVLDRRNRSIGIMKSEVHHVDGRLLVTAVGSYSIFPARGREPIPPIPEGAHSEHRS